VRIEFPDEELQTQFALTWLWTRLFQSHGAIGTTCAGL